MGITDGFKDKAKDISDAAAEEVNEKTGDKYADKVDRAKQQVQDKLGLDEDRPEQSQK
ncbi:Rv0909 family putative TA system antitoxin [Streptomyces spectabilis]|uniref:Antitoxin n=1 Tax=Streptomyces spectabilis TaxID=68270 RepID=A0A516R8K2_STRST|nr:Rv0909 family putative TA system antitoxin [Streptomyces spectabilis]QDQ11986.1 antitoxin [Streptomyces spectabilis]